MSAKRKTGQQAPRAIRQLQDRTPDSIKQIQDTGGEIPRLGIVWNGPSLLDAERFAHRIESHPGALYFLDSTQFIGPMAQRIWQALLADKRIAMTPPVYQELEWWLNDPKETNLEVHHAIKNSASGDDRSPIAWVGIENPALESVCDHYVNLLGMRKRMFVAARVNLEKQLGRPANKQEVSNYCQQLGTSRAQLLGRQGENIKVPAHKYNDECLVVLAIMFAIVKGREVVIVSSDEAVFDQFYKAIWLMDTHYRSMLLADRYVDNPSAFPSCEVDNPHKEAFSDESVLLLTKPSDGLSELLPVEHSPVLVRCVLLQNGFETEMVFKAEREMRRVFDIKARTNGLSTDKLSGKNCHVFLGDMAISRLGNRAAIATDQAVALPGREIKLSVVDVNLALLSDEHFTRIEIVNP